MVRSGYRPKQSCTGHNPACLHLSPLGTGDLWTGVKLVSAVQAHHTAMDTGRQLRTCSKDLREDAFLVAAVNVVRRFSGLVRAVQQAAIFGVPEEELSQAPAPPTNGDVKRCVSLLHKQEMRSFSSDCTEDNQQTMICKSFPPYQQLKP